MLILLPPSEGKSAAVTGPPVDLSQLHFPGLNHSRGQVLAALAAASSHEDALGLLKVGASLLHEVQRNTMLADAPAAPAHTIYSGVLYDALGYRTMTPVQRRKADATVVVISALWGAIRFADPIPAYRLSMTVDLPGTGRLAQFWRPRLAEALDLHSRGSLIVDCRSSSYAAAWAAPVECTVAVNVFQDRVGKRTVVSHFAKHTRGELARHLLTRRGKMPETAAQLRKAAAERWTSELEPATGRRAAQLNLLLS